MIEEFAVPRCVLFVLRLSGRYYRQRTGWRARRQVNSPPAIDPETESAAEATTSTTVEPFRPQAPTGSVLEPALSEGRLTLSFLEAAKAMEERTKLLVAASIGPSGELSSLPAATMPEMPTTQIAAHTETT